MILATVLAHSVTLDITHRPATANALLVRRGNLPMSPTPVPAFSAAQDCTLARVVCQNVPRVLLESVQMVLRAPAFVLAAGWASFRRKERPNVLLVVLGKSNGSLVDVLHSQCH